MEDGTWADANLVAPLAGRAAIEAYAASLMAAMPDLAIRQEILLVDPDRDDRIATRWSLRGTFRRDFDAAGQAAMPLAATGDRVVMAGVALMTLRDGLAERLEQFGDYATFQRQNGVLPPPGSATARTLAALQRLGARRRRRKNPN